MANTAATFPTLTYYVTPFSKGWKPERRKLIVPNSMDAAEIAMAVFESCLATGMLPDEIKVSGGRLLGDAVFVWLAEKSSNTLTPCRPGQFHRTEEESVSSSVRSPATPV